MVKLPGAMFIGIGQRRTLGGDHPQMGEFPLAGGKAMADLPERVGTAQLAKQHGDKLAPRAKAAGMPLGSGLINEQLELGAREKLENLTKHATNSIHVGPPVLWGCWDDFGKVSQTIHPQEAQLLNLNLDKSDVAYHLQRFP